MRCVPLEPTVALLERERCGDFMDFDPELTVRLMWADVPVVNVPTHVRYFDDGISHFRLVRDNARLTLRYTRLFFGMLLRSPRLLMRALAGRHSGP